MNEIHDDAAPYVLGALAPEARARFETHLTGCAQCRAEVSRLGEGLEQAFWNEAETAPDTLRVRVARSVGADRSPRPRSYRWLAMAAVVVAVVGFVGFLLRPTDPIDAVLSADDAVEYVVPATDAGPQGAELTVTYSPSIGRSVVTGSGLADVPAGSTYQMWFVGDGGPIPAGLFQPEDGSVTTLVEGDFQSGSAFGITVEPAGGSSTPTGDILFLGEL